MRLVISATLAACLMLAACGGADESAPETAPATTAAATTGPATSDVTSEAASETTSETNAPAALEFLVEVQEGAPVGGIQELEVPAGSEVRIEVAVDAAQELHLHGYDLEGEATPAEPTVFEFTADLEGVFELESHASDEVIAKLIVAP
jgi:hypothetical protein